jgi:hypothetical protein
MPANAVVRARIDARVKEEAAAIFAAAGLTLSDASGCCSCARSLIGRFLSTL